MDTRLVCQPPDSLVPPTKMPALYMIDLNHQLRAWKANASPLQRTQPARQAWGLALPTLALRFWCTADTSQGKVSPAPATPRMTTEGKHQTTGVLQ